VLCASQEIGSETTCIVLNWIIHGVLVAQRLGHRLSIMLSHSQVTL